MPNPLNLIKAGRAAKATAAVDEVSPLAQAVAARMIGQLNAVGDIGGLSALKNLNVPAAYAGDQRSLKSVQRAINEAETGIASPGRRNFMKQAAATAARQAVPEAVDTALGVVAQRATPNVVEGVAIPDESIQAAILQSLLGKLGTGTKARNLMQSIGSEYLENGALSKPLLSAQDISSAHSLPLESVEAFLKKNGVESLDDIVGDSLSFKGRMAHYENGADPIDAGIDVDPEFIDDIVGEAYKELFKRKRAITYDQAADLAAIVNDRLLEGYRSRYIGDNIKRVFGEEGAAKFLDQTGLKQQTEDAFWDYIGSPSEHVLEWLENEGKLLDDY